MYSQRRLRQKSSSCPTLFKILAHSKKTHTCKVTTLAILRMAKRNKGFIRRQALANPEKPLLAAKAHLWAERDFENYSTIPGSFYHYTREGAGSERSIWQVCREHVCPHEPNLRLISKQVHRAKHKWYIVKMRRMSPIFTGTVHG